MREESTTLLQRIEITWTKKSRSAPGAVKRNHLPKVYEIPLQRADRLPCVVVHHKINYYESEDFRFREIVLCQDTFPVMKSVELEPLGGLLRVLWWWDNNYTGQPPRDSRPKTAFLLNADEWGQIVYNGRFTAEDTWYYKEVIVNVGLFRNLTNDCFLDREPNYFFDQKARLF